MQFRPAQESDWRYICPTFISSFREKSTHSEGMSGKLIASLITNLISNGWECMVAETEGVIAGWAVYRDKNHLAWVFTRPMFREQGLAKLLVGKCSIDMSAPIYSPFVPNREIKCKLRLKIRQRPFCVVPTAAVH